MLETTQLQNSLIGETLGILVGNKLCMSQLCAPAKTEGKYPARPWQSLGSRQGKRFFLVALVKPHLERCVQVWAPQYKRGMGMLEAAQQRTTTIIKGLENLLPEESYKEWLRKLGLLSLKRKLRGDFTDSCK